MPVKAVVGTQWGDEGKGRMVDLLAKEAAAVVRFQGGNNAGHTIYNEHGKFVFNLLPSGMVSPGTKCVIGTGVVVDIEGLLGELASLKERISDHGQLYISERAHIVLPYHKQIEHLLETNENTLTYGSTKRGIAQAYQFKVAKVGLQMADLCEGDAHLKARLDPIIEFVNIYLKGLDAAPITTQSVLDYLKPLRDQILPYICDTNKIFAPMLKADEKILVEGQLGTMRDLDWGIYPYTTSSNPIAGFASVGAGLSPKHISEVMGVVKAYSSCVGEGAFVVEMGEEEANVLRTAGNEFGATTGRPRRVGWFDGVATKFGADMQGATELCITLLDVLSQYPTIRACDHYIIDGEVETFFPTNGKLMQATPNFIDFDGWQTDITGCRKLEDLPSQARSYLDWMEEYMQTPITHISVGPERDQIIFV